MVKWSGGASCTSIGHYVGHMVWQPSWILQKLNKAHNSHTLARSMFELVWSVVPHV